ncbi:MAG: hypothetical protein ABEJ44_05445 [Halanaeroarchaeum sp.]
MARVSASRRIEAPPPIVESVIRDDVAGFVAAGGFDEVRSEGDVLAMSRNLGLASLELEVRVDHDADVVLAFEAVDGLFEQMRTEYAVENADEGSRITAWTEFTLGGFLGEALDETLVSTQRKREFEDQFEYVQRRVEATDAV